MVFGTRERVVERHRGLAARTLLVSLLTLLSRLLGFVRESAMAFIFGDKSALSDAFFTAFRVPNLFRRMFGEGALSTALQSALTEADHERGDQAGRRLFWRISAMTTALLVVITAIAILLIAAAPDRMPFFGFPWFGKDPGPVRDLMVRIFPFLILMCAAALCGGALAVRGHFAVPNFAPSVMNLVWIGTLFWIGAEFGATANAQGSPEEVFLRQWEMARWLVWGLLLGGVLQLLVHVPALRRFGFLGPRRELAVDASSREDRARAWAVVRTTVPLVIGAAVYQINVMIDGLMAEGLLPDGGPTALYYANRTQQFPLALIATAVVNAVFPALKAHAVVGDKAEVRRLHDRTQLWILFLSLPAAVGLGVLALPISSVLYEHGNYGLEGTQRIAVATQVLAFALVPAGAAGLVGRAYVALGDLATPVRVAIVMVIANALLNAFFVVQCGMDVAGLCLATALTTWVSLAWLLAGLRARLGLPPSTRDVSARIGRMLLAALLSGAFAWAAHRATAQLLGVVEARRSALALAAGSAAGFLGYLGAVRLLGVAEWNELAQRVRRRLAR